MELLVGAGRRHERRIAIDGRMGWSELVTLDINPDHEPDVVWDLTKRPLPFEDDTFDEIHAYEVLEHLGTQGDWRAWFEEWSEWYRILKPGGLIVGTSPCWDNVWAWGDPGHTRVMTVEAFTYLSQPEYTRQIGVTAMTDYRFVFRGDFDLAHAKAESGTLQFGLQAVKPSRISI
jgi:SAM-dependent methyltransferase